VGDAGFVGAGPLATPRAWGCSDGARGPGGRPTGPRGPGNRGGAFFRGKRRRPRVPKVKNLPGFGNLAPGF